MSKKRETTDEAVEETPELEDEPGEFPVRGHEPLNWPKGLKVADLLARLDALESAVFGKDKK